MTDTIMENLEEAIGKLQAENARLREQAEALAEALQDLMDEQNGPPLIRDAEYWQAAWDKSAAALAAYRAQEAGPIIAQCLLCGRAIREGVRCSSCVEHAQ